MQTCPLWTVKYIEEERVFKREQYNPLVETKPANVNVLNDVHLLKNAKELLGKVQSVTWTKHYIFNGKAPGNVVLHLSHPVGRYRSPRATKS